MIRSKAPATCAAVATVLALAACGGARAQAHTHGAAPAPAAGAQRPPHTEADVRFMTMMIAHHAQAVRMSRMAPTHGANPSVRVLAERIISAQEDEIATMRQWLRDRGEPVPDSAAAVAHDAHAGHGAHAAAGAPPMHGMLTEEEMQRLDRARGTQFDRLFLSSMIRHHRGAVGMVAELFGTPGAGQDPTVFKFASDVQVDQTTEIARMERMLAALIVQGGAP